MRSPASRTAARGWPGPPLPEYTHNFTSVEVPGEMTISRSATYHETSYVDPESGEVYPGCYDTESPVDCAVEKTVPATLEHRRHVGHRGEHLRRGAADGRAGRVR